VDSTWAEVGLAALPSRASKVSSVYAGRLRHMSFTQSRPAEPWVALIEYDLRLRRGVEPLAPGGLFPAVDRVRGDLLCAWSGEGAFATGRVERADQRRMIPVPRGSLGGGVIPLDDGFYLHEGRLGRALPGRPDYLPAGTRLTGRFLVPGRSNQVGSYDRSTRTFEDAPEAWLRAMGFAGETPYRIALTRGEMGMAAFVLPVQAENGGVAGEITGTAEIPYDLPLQISGLNPRWSVGVWREGEPVRHTGVFEDTAWPRLDVGRAGRFYAGHLVFADDPRLVLSLAVWDGERIIVDVHNPTGAPITATVATPSEIAGYAALRRAVTVGPGASETIAE
jgi:hypothetical protein